MVERSPTTWSRDDRDLLVELRTQMLSVQDTLKLMDGSIKAIDTGISNRVLNLEGNSVRKITVDALEAKVDKLYTRMYLVITIGGAAWSLILVVVAAYFGNVHL